MEREDGWRRQRERKEKGGMKTGKKGRENNEEREEIEEEEGEGRRRRRGRGGEEDGRPSTFLIVIFGKVKSVFAVNVIVISPVDGGEREGRKERGENAANEESERRTKSGAGKRAGKEKGSS